MPGGDDDSALGKPSRYAAVGVLLAASVTRRSSPSAESYSLDAASMEAACVARAG